MSKAETQKIVTSTVFVGDCHLKPQTWNSRPEIKGDAYESFTQIIEFCIGNNASLVLTGDILNSSKPDSQSIDVFRKGIDAMAAADLPVYAIQGQHDRSSPPWPLAIDGNWVQYVHKKEFQPVPGGPTFMGFDNYAVKEELKAELAAVPKNVTGLALHQLAKQVFDLEGSWDFDAEWVPEHVRELIIGDFHEAVEFNWHTTKKAMYSGSTYMCSISEPVDKSFIHAKLNGRLGLDYTRVALKTRQCVTYVINDEQQLTQCLIAANTSFPVLTPEQLKSVISTPILVVNYAVTVPRVELEFRTNLEGRAYFWPKPVSIRTVISRDGLAADTEEHHVSMENCVEKFAPAGTETNKLVIDLLTQPSAEDVLTDWRTKKKVV